MPDPAEHPRPFYYLEHLEEVLQTLLDRYREVLDDPHRAWIDALLALPRPARGLYARFMGRRGFVFREAKLRYPELEPLPKALDPLAEAGWIRPAQEVWADYPLEVLHCFTHAELRRAFPNIPGKRRSEWEEGFLDQPPTPAEISRLLEAHPCWFQEHTLVWERLNLLYFGNRWQSTEQFVIHELGHVTVESRAEKQFTPTFSTTSGWLDTAAAYQLRDRLYDALDSEQPDVLRAWVAIWQAEAPQHADAQRVADKTRLKAAHACEQHGWVEEALSLYREAERPPARERRVRLLRASGRPADALDLAREMAASPRSPEEAEFAHNVLEGPPEASGPIRARATRLLKESDTLLLPITWKNRVEAGAATWFRSLGWSVVHAENGPWRQLAGALCWDVFNGPDMSFHHALQRTPDDVLEPGFYGRHQAAISNALAVLENPDSARHQLQRIRHEKAGIASTWVADWNGRWHGALALIDHVPGTVLRSLLINLLEDPGNHGRGLPDLLLWRKGECRLREIKGPGDQLRPAQLQWMAKLQQAGVDAAILRVVWQPRRRHQ